MTTPREQAAADLFNVWSLACESSSRSGEEQDSLIRVGRALDGLGKKVQLFAGTEHADQVSCEQWAVQTCDEVDGEWFAPRLELVVSPLLCDTDRGTAQRMVQRGW